MKYTATSVSFRYLPSEDRIQWVCHCQEGNAVAVWVTRRILKNLIPQFAEWLNHGNETIQSVAGNMRSESMQHYINRMEHAVAQEQVKAVNKREELPALMQKFILDGLSLRRTKEGAVMVLLAKNKALEIVFRLSLQELHKIIGELLKISQRSGWELEHPWYSRSSGDDAANELSLH